MQLVSDRWWPALARSVIRPVCFANIFDGPGGNQIAGPLQIFEGMLTVDQTNVIRRSCQQVKMVDPTGAFTPSDPSDALFPDGSEIVISYGNTYPDGTTEAVSLGTLMLEQVWVDSGLQPGTTEIWIDGSDHGGRIARAGLTQPYATDGVSTLDVAIKALIEAAVPNVAFQYRFAPCTFVPAVMTLAIGADPWQSACTLASSGGYELFPDVDGVLVLQEVVDPSTLPVVGSYIEGPNVKMVEARKMLVNTSSPNWVIVTASGSNIPTPLRSDWQDTDPRSYTYIGELSDGPGSYPIAGTGKYPLTVQNISTSLAQTQDAVDAMATAAGLASKGLLDGLYFRIPTNAALDANDVLTITRTPAGIVGPRNYVFDSWTYMLGFKQPMYGQARRVY